MADLASGVLLRLRRKAQKGIDFALSEKLKGFDQWVGDPVDVFGGRPRAALPFRPRSDQQPAPPPPRSRHCRRTQSFQDPKLPHLGGNLQRWVACDLQTSSRSPKFG